MGRAFQSCKMKRILGGDGWWQWLYNLMPQNSTLKMVKPVNFMSGLFYHIRKINNFLKTCILEKSAF